MAIWRRKPNIEQINSREPRIMVDHLGIKITGFDDDSIVGTMPVDERTNQPMGILHGGANVVLAETLGSLGSYYSIDPETQICVGLEVNANHIRSVRDGLVTGIARPYHIGRSTHVWEIKITSQDDKLVSISRLTMAILDKARGDT